MKKRKKNIARALWPLALLAVGEAHAAGGHHSVDDAGILEPGRCEQEDWFTWSPGGARLLHAGLNCRVGAVELGIAGEHAHDGTSATAWNLEAKWAHKVIDGFSVGLDVQPVRVVNQHPDLEFTRFVGLATWEPRDGLDLHLNLGRDFVRSGRDLARYGVGVDWSPVKAWTLTVERYKETETHFLRGGVRWEGGSWWKLDFSRAQSLGGPTRSTWSVGVTFVLGQ